MQITVFDVLGEFSAYKNQIAEIIMDLNKRKDKPGQWLQWMNLGYSEETIWYVKEYAAIVQGHFDNVLVLGIGGSALSGIAVTEALLKTLLEFTFCRTKKRFTPNIFMDNIDPDSMSGLWIY